MNYFLKVLKKDGLYRQIQLGVFLYLLPSISFGQITANWQVLNLDNPPAKRIRHTMVTVDDYIVIYGGLNFDPALRGQKTATARNNTFNDVIVIDGSGESEVINDCSGSSTNPAPNRRQGHATAFDEARHKVRTFGGYDENTVLTDGDGSFLTAGELFRKKSRCFSSVNNLRASESKAQARSMMEPDPRFFHTIEIIGDILYSFGGADINLDIIDDILWQFDLNTNQWSEGPSNPNGGFYQIASAVMEDNIYFFGGTNGFTSNPSGILSRFNTNTNTWETIIPTGDTPPARFGASLIAFNKFLIMFGGSPSPIGDIQTLLNDLWIYDTENNTWQQLANAPSVMLFHAAALLQIIVEESKQTAEIIVFGGFQEDENNLIDISNQTLKLQVTIDESLAACAEDLALVSGDFLASTTNTFQTQRGIATHLNTTVGDGSTLNLKSGEVVVLKPGFSAVQGSAININIENCVATLVESIPTTNETTVVSQEVSTTIDLPSVSTDPITTTSKWTIPTLPSVKVYPNPVSTTTQIELSLEQAMSVQLDLLDLQGRKIAELVPTASMQKGVHIYQWECDRVGSGTYLLVLNGRQVGKLVVMR